MKPKLTDKEKADNKQRSNLNSLCNRLLSGHQLKSIKTWEHVYKTVGMTSEDILSKHADNYQKEITYVELKAYCEELKQSLEALISSKAEQQISRISLHPTGGTTSQGQATDDKASSQVDKTVDAKHPVTEAYDKVQEEKATEANNYGLIDSPNENVSLLWFQSKAAAELLNGIVKHKRRSQLELAPTGAGKTFIAGAVVRRLVDMKFADGKTYGATKYLYVTRSSIVEQTKRVFKERFNLGMKEGVEILNIEQLRARAGQIWLNEKTVIQNGQEQTAWEWKKMMHPVVILWDECQALKNEDSTQHKIAASYNDLGLPETYQVFISASPFTRISEGKCFAVATHKDIHEHLGVPQAAYISSGNWSTYASSVASPASPYDHNEAATERFTKDLEEYIVRVRNIRSQFRAKNSIRMIDFRNDTEKQFYLAAWDRYQEEKMKLEREGVSGGGIGTLVQFLKFRMAAEECRAPWLAAELKRLVEEGYAAGAALNFKPTIIKAVIELDKLGFSRDKISIVWGGGSTALTKKQRSILDIKAKAEELMKIGMTLQDVMKTLDITEEDLIEAEERSEVVLPPHLRLGSQSREERQREIDRFQQGKTLICLYTFKAGGVGLSLHHTDEQTTDWDKTVPGYDEWRAEIDAWNKHRAPNKQVKPGKVRKKESGYAFEQDIPFVPVRPRRSLVAPTYSAFEMVQGLGRFPRITSLSDTVQEMVFYRGTIEEGVAMVSGQKLRCLTKVVRQKEDWQDIVIGGVSVEEHVASTDKMSDDSPDDLGADDDDE